MMNLSPSKSGPIKWAAVIIFLILLTGCVSKLMKTPVGENASYPPKPGKALLVFMRPSSSENVYQSSVFHIISGSPELVGIVSDQTKVAYYTNPGEHLFMVIGDTADFMEANVLDGKIYHTLITPRPGPRKTTFSLRPIHQKELEMKKLPEKWCDGCIWLENTPASFAWAKGNRVSINTKMLDSLLEWKKKSEKPILYPTDGI